MPSGRRTPVSGRERPNRPFTVVRKKSAYLKKPSSPRFRRTETANASFAVRVPRRRSMHRLSAQFETDESSSRNTYTGSPNA